MKKKTNNFYIIKKLNVLFTSFGLCKEHSNIALSMTIVGKCERWSTCEGLPGLKRFKTYSNYFIRGVMGICEPIPFSSRHKRHFNKCIYLARKSYLASVYWVSVFSVYRLFTRPPVEDTSTITSRFKGSLFELALSANSLYRATLSFRSYVDQNWSADWKWHISGAAGPNGQLAYTRYLDDLYAIRNEGLWWKLLVFIKVFPYKNREETFKALKDAVYQSWTGNPDKQFIHSRLCFLSDKGGKTRVVGLVDILSQSCLKTVHQRCNRILRRLETDGTFDQDKQRARVRKWSEDKVFLASIDLSAATDRIPALYQVFVLIGTRILTPLQAWAWWLVTTRRTFTYGKVPKHVRYRVGQPMGALSSWPVMAISHHVLIWWSFKLAFPTRDPLTFTDYAVLGDDIVIANEEVSKAYLKLIGSLGIDYASDKSMFAMGKAEFAKSLFLRGKDLTPFPLKTIVFDKTTLVSNVLALLNECSRRKLRTTLATLTGMTPDRWNRLLNLAVLSPQSPKSALDVQSREDHGIFFSFLLIQKIKYFADIETVRMSTHAFAINDPGKSGKRLSSPFLQIGQDNGVRYPVRRLEDKRRCLDPIPILGYGWISYCSQAWPDGLPTLGSYELVPGPTWSKRQDDIFVRSSLIELEKVLPGYFTKRCVGTQVGDVEDNTSGGEKPEGSRDLTI